MLDVKDKIKSFIVDYFVKDSGLVLDDDLSFLEKGIIDSTGVMELVSFLETTFDIRLEDEEIIPDNFDSVNKLVNFIHQKMNGSCQSSAGQ
ncbi:MAG: acyl carrier protein [Dehalococcoidales bacterium]|nr:acyl carrier protein [Dehalococcoidales bacterium]